MPHMCICHRAGIHCELTDASVNCHSPLSVRAASRARPAR
jgi:hypothetical protein